MNEVINTELLPGTTLCNGKYVIEKKIGSGGFGITYLAKHSTLEKFYAIKEFFISGFNVRNSHTNHVTLQGIDAKDFNRFRQGFIDEARILAGLNNEAVVKVLDIFDENGTSYMVMPFVSGITLQSMVERDGPMSYEDAVNYIVQICEALSYIHSKNILHRDVTPDNVIVTPEMKAVLIDFGSARKFTNDKTQRHTAIVKQGYAPLEQYSANSRKGAYTDLYSLGAVFYYLLTGERPMDATERTNSMMKEPIEINPKVPAQINAVIMKAMEMDSSQRYRTADELIEDIMMGNAPTRYQPNAHSAAVSSTKMTPRVATNHSAQNSQPQGKNLKYAAILLACLAAIIVGLIAVRPLLNGTQDSYQTNEETVVESESPIVRAASLSLASCDSVMTLLEHNPNDPVALYAIATKAYNDEYSPNRMEAFWEHPLRDDGDIDRHILTDKKFTQVGFAFVCAARAYEIVSKDGKVPENYTDFTKALVKFLDELQALYPNDLKYERHE